MPGEGQLDYGFTTVHQTAISELLRILSLEVVCNGSNYEIREREGLRLDYGKNLESLHHGIASAFLLLQHLDWPCQTLTTRPGYFADKDDAIQALLLSTLLGTISSHTNMNWYTKVFNDMYTLLFLCDELEEFSRYARSPESHEWEEVRYRTQVEWTDRSMSMTFTLDNRNVTDFEHFWKDKVRKIHRHFECTAGAIEEISITGRDLTRAPAITYTYRHRQGSAPEIAGPNDCEGFVAELDLL